MFMKGRFWFWLFLLVLESAVLHSQASDFQPQARAFVDSLAKRQFAEAVTHFDETISRMLPAEKLSATWQQVIDQAGEFKSISGTRQQEIKGYQVVFVSCHFSQSDLDVRVVFDSQGRVAGLFFVPPQVKPAAPAGSAAAAAKPADIAGDWMGTLNIRGISLRLVFHIKAADDGLHATFDSPDQAVFGSPISSAQFKDGVVRLESEKTSGRFEGALSGDFDTLAGTWHQGMASWPLDLKRVKSSADLERHPRPQEPKKPYPYREEDVAYDNKAGGNQLGATLTIPAGKGPFPAVLLICGTGRHDRDETIVGHKPFLVLADHLTRKGIAVLRVDSRGAGKSTGNFATATDADFASDAEAGIAYLKSRPEVDPRRIGLLGHSEGGFVTSIVGARNPDLGFVVMMAGPGVRGDELIVAQAERVEEVAGKSHEAALKDGATERKLLTLVEQTPDNASLKKLLHEELAGIIPEDQIDSQVASVGSPWFRYFIAYDPAPDLKKLKCPVLALIGTKDVQVPAEQNLPAIRAALQAGGNKNFETVELPGLNHLFQTAQTGALDEYATIEETIAPAALEKISGWILKTSVRAGAN